MFSKEFGILDTFLAIYSIIWMFLWTSQEESEPDCSPSLSYFRSLSMFTLKVALIDTVVLVPLYLTCFGSSPKWFMITSVGAGIAIIGKLLMVFFSIYLWAFGDS